MLPHPLSLDIIIKESKMSSKPIYSSPLCSCICCREIKSSKGIFLHYVLKHTIEGNAIASARGKLAGHDFQSNQRQQNITEYNKNPKKCEYKNCNNELNYNKRFNIFCSSSCAASQNNTLRPPGHPSRIKNNHTRSKKVKTFADGRPKYSVISFCTECNKTIRYKRVKTCSKECRNQIFSRNAKNNTKFGGNKNTRAYGWYFSPTAGKVWLESSYEAKVAQELDQHKITWIRPKYLTYKNKKYFADFFLTEFNVYLDPKNDYLIQKDQDKIKAVMEENNVLIIILNKDQLTWEKISSELSVRFELTVDY